MVGSMLQTLYKYCIQFPFDILSMENMGFNVAESLERLCLNDKRGTSPELHEFLSKQVSCISLVFVIYI